jgi:hypothetical protein
LPEDGNRAGLQNIMLFEKICRWIKLKNRRVSVNLRHAVFSLFLFSAHDDLVMQAMIWLRMVQYREICFGVVWFGALYMNFIRPHIFKHQI